MLGADLIEILNPEGSDQGQSVFLHWCLFFFLSETVSALDCDCHIAIILASLRI